MKLKVDISRGRVASEELDGCKAAAEAAMEKLWSGNEEFTGWVKLPLEQEKPERKDEFNRILETALKIQKQCEEFIVIGIGGSSLGARAGIHALADNEYWSSNIDDNEKGSAKLPVVKFAGNNISADYHRELIQDIKNKEVCICMVSKSGTTMEPALAFAILKEALIEKYGRAHAASRIYAITDEFGGILRQEADREGYVSFVVPSDIGGRYSILTAVGLLPMAVAGIDIRAMLEGAAEMAAAVYAERAEAGFTFKHENPKNKSAAITYADSKNEKIQKADFSIADYAKVRFCLLNQGKTIEIFEYYEPQLIHFAEWLKQLFGESEGKNGKGLFPSSLQFSEDLHSMGQFLQDGNQIFFETVINVQKTGIDIRIPDSVGLHLAGKSMNEVNQATMEGVMVAHEFAGIPMIKIDVPELTPYYFGQMIYFFETTCGVTAYMMGVNPFDQPGVETYKAEIRRMLNV